jgi:hypothetical protein
VKKYTYNFEIKDLLTQFVAAFDDTIIKRYDESRNVRQELEVRYVFAPKQRVMYDIINKAQNITLPVVTVDLASVSYDSSRAFNKVNKLRTFISEDESISMDMPTPINLEINMSILGRYMQDIEQIITNFAPYTNPYIILAWKEPTSNGETIEVRSEVIWSEDISLNTPTETTYSDKFRVVADTSFTIKGWLFKNTNTEDTPIYFIDQNLVAAGKDWKLQQPLESLDYDNFFNNFKDDPDNDTYVTTTRLSGVPEISNIYLNTSASPMEVSYVSPITLNKQSADYSVYNYTLIGDNYDHTTSVLLSSNNLTLTNNLTTFDTEYTGPITGFILPKENYTVMSNNTMNITMPYLSGSGDVDIIINNPAGWTSTKTISGFYMIAE